MTSGFPFYYISDIGKFYDTRNPGSPVTIKKAAERLLLYLPDEFPATSSALGALEQAMQAPISMEQYNAIKVSKKSPKVRWLDIYQEMQELFPFYSHVTAKGERQIYFANSRKELTPVSYKDDDSLINSLMYNGEIWTQLNKYYLQSELLTGHRDSVDMRAFLIRIVKSHLLLDRDHCIFEQPKRFSWEPNEFAFKKFDPIVLQSGPTPTWDEFLTRLDYPEIFKAWVWAIFEPTNNIRQVMWLYGGGNDGKSAVQKALIDLFGRDNSVSFQKNDELGDNARWFGRKVYGKGLATYADCENVHLLSAPPIKQLTGGDATSIEGKGVDSFSGEIYAKLLISSNKTPRINPELEAHTSRLIRLRVAPIAAGSPKDEGFKARLVAEGMAFLSQCQDSYSKYINSGNDALILPEDLAKGIIDDCANETYYVLQEFVEKYLEFGPEFHCRPPDLSLALKKFLNDDQYLTADKARYFRDDFDAKLSLKGVSLGRADTPKGKVTAYIGFKLKEVKSEIK